MSRPLRIEYAGAWYHVMNRGLARQTIFYNDLHHRLFLEILDEAHNRYQIQIHAYCLMKNHYHLLIHTPLPNLGRAMRHIDGVYTIKSNRLIGRDGPLFRGRYKAILVEAENYLLTLSRYIHLNPYSAKIVKAPEDYPWSSYRFFLNGKNPVWLYSNETLKYFSTNEIDNYKKFIHEGIKNKDLISLNVEKFPIFGSETFIEKIKNEVLNQIPDCNITEHLNLLKKFYISIHEVIHAVTSYYNPKSLEILNDKLKKNKCRDIAIYLCYQLTGNSFKSLKPVFNEISIPRLSKIYKNIESKLKIDLYLKEEVKTIKSILLKEET